MPYQSTGPTAYLDSIAGFKESPLHEMLVSLESLSNPWCPPELAESAQQALGNGFREELTDLYRPLNHGMILSELAFAFSDHEDIPEFLRRMEAMPAREFLWHILGRAVRPEDVPETVSPSSLAEFVENLDGACSTDWYVDYRWAEDFPGFQAGLVRLWSRYWDAVFRHDLERLRPMWRRSIEQQARRLRDGGARNLFAELTGDKPLPEPLPADMPYERLEFVPLVRFHKTAAISFFGWGKMSVLYDCCPGGVLSRQNEEARKDGIALRLKALADDRRLEILRLISFNEQVVNGQWLARQMGLSPSVVSRHLSQLKTAGLIEEHSADNRNYTYSILRDSMDGLALDLEAYLTGRPPTGI